MGVLHYIHAFETTPILVSLLAIGSLAQPRLLMTFEPERSKSSRKQQFVVSHGYKILQETEKT